MCGSGPGGVQGVLETVEGASELITRFFRHNNYSEVESAIVVDLLFTNKYANYEALPTQDLRETIIGALLTASIPGLLVWLRCVCVCVSSPLSCVVPWLPCGVQSPPPLAAYAQRLLVVSDCLVRSIQWYLPSCVVYNVGVLVCRWLWCVGWAVQAPLRTTPAGPRPEPPSRTWSSCPPRRTSSVRCSVVAGHPLYNRGPCAIAPCFTPA